MITRVAICMTPTLRAARVEDWQSIKAVLEAGLRVPDDVAIIGAGNVHYSDLLRVPLSTVDQGSSTIGSTAAKILLKCIQSKEPPEPQSVQLPPELIVRDSSRRKR